MYRPLKLIEKIVRTKKNPDLSNPIFSIKQKQNKTKQKQNKTKQKQK